MALEYFSHNIKNLYSERLPILVKLKNGERTHQLHVSLDLEIRSCGEKVMTTKLTDDNDPYFLYTDTMTSSDYEVCRCAQGFLVSFDEFPAQVVKFLDLCKLGSSPQLAKYTLSLEEVPDKSLNNNNSTNALLKVIEVSHFKQSCHLALQLKAASDKEIIKQMSSLIKHLKENGSKYCNIINELELKLSESIKSNETKERELDDLSKRWQEEKRLWKSSHCKELEKEKDQLLILKKNLEDKFIKERVEIEDKYFSKIKKLEDELARTMGKLEAVSRKEFHIEATCKERCSKMEELERENATLLKDVISLRKRNNQLDKECYDKDANLNMLVTKSAVLEQEAKDKRLLVTKQQELLRLASDNKNRLEEIINDREATLKKKLETVKNLTDELVTANQVINNLSSEILSLKDKVNTRTHVVLEQEKIIESHKQIISTKEEELSSLKENLKQCSIEEEKLKECIKTLEEKLSLTEEKLKSNENVINFLHRKQQSQQATTTSSSGVNSKPLSKFAALSKQLSTEPSRQPPLSFLTSTPYGSIGSKPDESSSPYLPGTFSTKAPTMSGRNYISRFMPETK